MILIHDADVAGAQHARTGRRTSACCAESAPALAESIRDRRPIWSVVAGSAGRGRWAPGARQAVVPLVVEDELGSSVEGMLLVGTSADGPDEATREILGALADLGAVAIRQARLHNALAERAEYLERLARTDPLTGLADRRTFEQMLELEVAPRGASGSALAVALFDVDDLSRHQRRPTARPWVTTCCATSRRRSRTRCASSTRWRGSNDDLFGVIAPGDAGGIVARRVQDAVKAHRRGGAGRSPASAPRSSTTRWTARPAPTSSPRRSQAIVAGGGRRAQRAPGAARGPVGGSARPCSEQHGSGEAVSPRFLQGASPVHATRGMAPVAAPDTPQTAGPGDRVPEPAVVTAGGSGV